MPFPREGPKEWTPKKIEKILEGLEELTADTSKGKVPPAILNMANLGQGDHLTFKSFHATDDPEGARRAIESGDLSSYENRSLCGGLYVSFHSDPRHSKKRYEFLKALSAGQKEALAEFVHQELEVHRDAGYIAGFEWKRGVRDVKAWLDQDNPSLLLNLTLQPFNIDIRHIAERQLIVKPFELDLVPVTFEGRYLHYNTESQWFSIQLAERHLKMPNRDVDLEHLCRTWKEFGWDGVFRTSPYSELVIWNADRILSFGETRKPRLSGRSGQEGGTVQEGRRFETSLSPNHQMAILQEIGKPAMMFGPMRLSAVEELRELLYRIEHGLDFEQGRFKADLSGELPAIVDTQIYRRISNLTDGDLFEMSFLLDDLAGRMQ